jgi:hypothetical protein
MLHRAVTIALLLAMTGAAASHAQSLIRKLLRIAGITAGGAVRGPEDEVVLPGTIWIADLSTGQRRPLTKTANFRTPVFSSSSNVVFALEADHVVRVNDDGTQVRVGIVPAAEKLAGFDADSPGDLVVLRADTVSPLAILAVATGTVTPLAYDPSSPDERRLLSGIRRQARTYGDTAVYLKRESKPGAARPLEWTDVYVRRGTEPPRNVSACEGRSCSQPALSSDKRWLVFVQVAEPR